MLLFTAPAFFPRDLLTPALPTASELNPLTYVVEAVRGLLAGDADHGHPWHGLAAAVGLALFSISLSTLALRDRLRRT